MNFSKDLRALTNLDLEELVKTLEIKNCRGVFMRDTLPTQEIRESEVGIVNLDSSDNQGTHWVCYSKNKRNIYYFDSFGLGPPLKLQEYLKSRNKKGDIKNEKDKKVLSTFQIQEFGTHHCGHYCLLLLKLLESYDYEKSVIGLM